MIVEGVMNSERRY